MLIWVLDTFPPGFDDFRRELMHGRWARELKFAALESVVQADKVVSKRFSQVIRLLDALSHASGL